jgi:hypothetical protein
VQRIDTEYEESLISEAVCLTLQCFDLVVGAFKGAGGDPMVVVREDSFSVSSQSLGKVLEYSDTRCLGTGYPV